MVERNYKSNFVLSSFLEKISPQTCPSRENQPLRRLLSLDYTHIYIYTRARSREEEEEKEMEIPCIVTTRVLINIPCMEITHVQPSFDALRSRTRKHVLTSRLRPCTVSLLDQCLPSSSVFVIQNRWLEVVSLLSSWPLYLRQDFVIVLRSWFRRCCSSVPFRTRCLTGVGNSWVLETLLVFYWQFARKASTCCLDFLPILVGGSIFVFVLYIYIY